ncbi:MAG: site-specific integrase, partial [Actinobacteria bacterium]|nr:site-specific integrase [Actinomycetota bacterium]
MRITMLVALLGRRISEICLLDRDPLLPLLPAAAARRPDPEAHSVAQAPVAKLRYQQTKIDDAPHTILVHAEVVAIIREQQQWAQRYFIERGAPGKAPKYLFLAVQMNRNGDRPYSDRTLRTLLTELALRLDVRDSTGAVVDFNRTHRFRHTVATSLLNAGVPLHVVQRYLGHLTPTMTMTYAQTLQSTAEAEFLRYRKITADGRDLKIDPRDLYDMLELDRRTDSDPAQRLVPAAPAPGLPHGQRLPDLRQVRHRRHIPPRAKGSAGPHNPAHRATPGRLPGPHRAGDRHRQHLARRAPPGTRRPRPHHPHPRAH